MKQHARPTSQLAISAVLIPLLVPACSTRATTERYRGTTIPMTSSPACQPTQASLTIYSDGRVIFIPEEGTIVLAGTASKQGAITATRDQPGANKRPFVSRLDASFDAGRLTGTYATPRCRFDVRMERR